MENRLRPSLALLISALVHGGIALVLLGQASRQASVGRSAEQGGPALMVRLVSAGQPAPHASEVVPAPVSARGAVPTNEDDLPVSVDEKVAEESDAAALGARPTESHYFGAGEVTELAVVAEGLIADRLLIVPGMKAQAVSLEVWVSDEGIVERVELDSSLPETERELLLAAFAKVRFLPGRIGRIAVHSRLSMRILVDYMLRA